MQIEELAGHGKEVEVDLAVTAEGDFDAVAGWFTLNLGPYMDYLKRYFLMSPHVRTMLVGRSVVLS